MNAVQFCGTEGNPTQPKRQQKNSPYWYYRVYLPDRFDPTKRNRQWVSSGTTNFAEAISFHYRTEWLAEIQKKYKAQNLETTSAKVDTVAKLRDYVLGVIGDGLQPNTITGYESAFRAFIRFLSEEFSRGKSVIDGGLVPLEALYTPLCRKFFNSKPARKAPVSFQRHYSYLSKSFKIALGDGIISDNAFGPIRKPKTLPPIKEYFRENNYDYMAFHGCLPNATFSDKTFRCMVELARYTGLRRKEICHVLERNITGLDSNTPNLFIESSDVRGAFRTKNGKSRNVPLVPQAVVAINCMKALKAAHTDLTIRTSPYLFPMEETGCAWKEKRLSVRFKLTRNLIMPSRKHLTFHSLRHSFAYWFIDDAMNGRRFDIYVTLCSILGHASPDFTARIYARPENITNMTGVFDHFYNRASNGDIASMSNLYDANLGTAPRTSTQ